MSFHIHAFCHQSVAAVTPAELTTGIAESLASLTYLFCPPKEEDPAEVLARLKIDDQSGGGPFKVFLLHYRKDSPLFIRTERHADRATIDEMDQQELLRQPDAETVRNLLAGVTEDVTFSLTSADLDGMGFPLAIAAARYLVKRAGGVILSGRYSWMTPNRGKDVDILAEYT